MSSKLNRNKRKDNIEDVIASLKTSKQADRREIFENRETGKLSYKKFNETIINLEDSTNPGNNTSFENVTYSELYSKISEANLTPGQWYRVTDYKSVNFLNGWQIANNNPIPTDPNFNPQEIYEGEVEVILVQAISTYQIAEVGYSETFQGDIIQYQPYTNKIGVDIGGIYNGNTLPDTSIVSGFDLQWDGTNVYFNMPTGYPALFGHYFYVFCEFQGETTYYQDGNFEPLTPGIATCQYPFTSDDPDFNYPKAMSRIQVVDNGMKVILLDLVEADYTNYVTDTLYVDHVYALGDAYGWITKRQDALRNITAPLDFRGRKYRRFEVDLTPVNSSLGVGYYGQGDNFLGQGTTGNYKDFKVFGQDGDDIWDIKWDDNGGADMLWYNGYSDNNIFIGRTYFNNIGYYCYNNTIGDNFYSNTIGNNFYFNTIGNYSNSNIIGNNFYSNTIGNYSNNNIIANYYNSNTIGNEFSYNTIGNNSNNNTIGNNFYFNTIGNNFNSNTIANYYNSNTIGNSFYDNNISEYFAFNKIGNYFNNNTIGYGFGFGYSTSQGNIIGNYFYQNNIGEYFYNNEIADGFFNNTLVDYFQLNKIKTTLYNTIFTLSTHVYGNYNCEIFRRSDNNLQLSYVDGTNTVQYAAVDA